MSRRPPRAENADPVRCGPKPALPDRPSSSSADSPENTPGGSDVSALSDRMSTPSADSPANRSGGSVESALRLSWISPTADSPREIARPAAP